MPRLSASKNSALGSDNLSNFSNVNNRKTKTERKISLAAMYMILYPVVYIIVTLPLAAGRIASLAGNNPSPSYLLIGGCFMTSAGWIDCLLYAFTRRAFLTTTLSTVNDGVSQDQSCSGKSRPSKKDCDIEMSPAVKAPISQCREVYSQASSSDRIMPDAEDLEITPSRGGVKVETTWEVMTKYIDNEGDDVDRSRHMADVFARL
jgi:G protein-coupled glucose receptor regulating Gpa2 C-term